MILDMKGFDELVEKGHIRKVQKDGMVLYNYTDRCNFDRAWNGYSLVARGIVLEESTGRVIAKPFPKFFNLGEMEETSLKNLPLRKGYHVYEKLDGSLGITFFYKGQWHMATRGSFDSERAKRGLKMLNKRMLRYMDERFTYLFEIIYPENKIIVNYGNEEKLVLIGAVHTNSAREVNPEALGYVAEQLGVESAMLYPYSIEEIIDLQKTLPKDQEGFVVRFTDGMRVKIKGDEYMKIARMLSNMTPLAFWEAMKQGIIPRQYLAQLPEEFRKDYEPIVRDLEGHYHMIQQEVIDDFMKLPGHDMTERESRKRIALFIKNEPLMHRGAMFPLLNKNYEVTDEYIKKKIRPKGNVLRVHE
jgi:RNA ligase